MQDRPLTHPTCIARRMVKLCQWSLFVLMLSLVALGALLAPRSAQAQSATKASADPLPAKVATIPLAGPVQDFLLDPATNRIYLTDQGGTLTILDVTDYTVLATLPVGGELTLDPRRPRLYVAPGFRAFGKPSAIQIIDPRYTDGSYRLAIGTGGGEVWLLNPAEMTWQAPLTVVATPVAASEVGGATQPLFSYTLAQTEPTQLVLRNIDGSHRRAVTLPAGIDDKRVRSFAPDGAWLAYYTGAVSRPNQPASDDLALHLLNMASGEVITVASLLPSDFPANLSVNARLIAERIPEVADDAQLAEGIWWGFAEALTLHAWSPDGRTLAFAGAMDGPSSDLYLFDVTTRTLTRLTDGPEQITALRWSPDGQWIWHSTVSIGFCQGCYGHKYAAARDGSRIITIPGDETTLFLGWVGPDCYLESDGANGIGDFHLYEVNLTGAPSRDLWAGSYSAFVINWDQQRMVIKGSPTPSLDHAAVALYEVNLNTGKFFTTSLTALQSGFASRLTQPPLLPCPFGNSIIDYPCDDTPFSPFSPDGQWWVDKALTLHTADKRPILPSAIPQPADQIFWRRDSAGFYFVVDGDLYYRALLDSWPMLIERGVANLTWLEDRSR